MLTNSRLHRISMLCSGMTATELISAKERSRPVRRSHIEAD